jgi:threonine aldolase
MDFRSDNTRGAAPEIVAALTAANEGRRTPYGEDAQTQQIEAQLKEIFETDLSAFLVSTGTAANSLGLAVLTPPWGVIYCHEEAHIAVDECAAPEFYTGGAKLVTLPGADARISAAQLAALLPAGKGFVHRAQPSTVSLTQATEAGTCYRPAQIGAIAEVARRHGLRLHMDGARFANALAFLEVPPAELTWRAGVEVLTFGVSKNGALAAEVVILFDQRLAGEFAFRRKRAGHLISKGRVLAAQLDAYLRDGLWLKLARHANAMARQLSDGLSRLPSARLVHPTEANEVFVQLPEPVIQALGAAGFQFYRWPEEDSTTLRLVTAFDTGASEVAALIDAVRRHSRSAEAAAGAAS